MSNDTLSIYSDEHFMKLALQEANLALDKDEIPVGAIIVSNNKIIAKGHNLTQTLNDATAHAEMIAFTAASEYLNGKYLTNCTLYVTLEPCIMCAGAAFWTKISRIVCGAKDTKRGFSKIDEKILHPKTKIEYGVLINECEKLINDFFAKKRVD